jgi:YfiH family protein
VKVLVSSQLIRLAHVEHAFLTADQTPPSGALSTHQVHSRRVLVVDDDATQDVSRENADGLVSREFHPISVKTADCLPVLIADTRGDLVAAVHCGWRGLAQGILDETIAVLEREGAGPGNLVIAIGPAIHQCCYEVGVEVTSALDREWNHLWRDREPPWATVQPNSRAASRSRAVGRTNGVWLDTVGLARMQLESCGVAGSRVEVVGSCTYCGPDAFASYRRNVHEQKGHRSQRSWIARRPLNRTA